MTTEAEAQAPGRTIDVSPAALAQIFPGAGTTSTARPASGFRRLTCRARMRLKLGWTRLRFRFDDFRSVRLCWAACRLRAKLAWLRLRHRDRFTRRDIAEARHDQAAEDDAGRDLLENTK